MWDPGLRQWGIASLRLTHDIRIVPFVLCIDYKGMFGCTIQLMLLTGVLRRAARYCALLHALDQSRWTCIMGLAYCKHSHPTVAQTYDDRA
jgi:hypothetical protein